MAIYRINTLPPADQTACRVALALRDDERMVDEIAQWLSCEADAVLRTAELGEELLERVKVEADHE